MPPTDLPRYRFGPLERRGIIGSLRKAQAALLGFGLVVGVIALRLAPTGINALLAGGALALTALIAFVPIQGRSLEEWTRGGALSVAPCHRSRRLPLASTPAGGTSADPGRPRSRR
jgi:hypothetical protein